MPQAVLTLGDLGLEFDQGVIESNKVRLKLGTTLARNALTGVIDVIPGASVQTFGSWTAPALRNRCVRFEPSAGSATSQTLGLVFSTAGTAAARPSLIGANPSTMMRRVGIVSAAAAGSLCYQVQVSTWLRAGTGTQGGFLFMGCFMVADALNTARMFYGLRAASALPSNVNPFSVLNAVGFGVDAGQTNYSFYSSQGAGTSIAVPLGADFPVLSQNAYDVAIYMPQSPVGGTGGYWFIRNKNTGIEASGSIASNNMPTPTTLLSFAQWRTNNTTASAASLDFGPMAIDSYDQYYA